ncbi:uncharacterized protein A4U43_C05F4290 [Asparagus officinalis]|uniref:Uncharacterized protein n=1 Tax=Asparagus officinalis TaxID=4686 RepID=A0A5P1EPI1_ASPOF|nr:uncharacterized protein A4U43_C05F4290 [Asparagus officinalis]
MKDIEPEVSSEQETRDASFKLVPLVQKPISSVLEKIRLRKLEVLKQTSILCQSDSVEASDCSVDEIVQKNSSNSSVRNQNDSRDNAGDAEVVGFPRMAFQSGVRIIQEMILGLHQWTI